MFFNQKKFVIENYNQKSPFASFLPGISGIWGKPLWTFYCNRGQGISSFGVRDKNGAILEFEAANKAYQHTSLKGFRTFLKIQNSLYEPFSYISVSENDRKQKMIIDTQTLTFIEENTRLGIKTTVEYFITPNSEVPSLCRKLEIYNNANKNFSFQLVDGLPIINPFGINDEMLKKMSRLAEALYSGTEFTKKFKSPIYKLKIAGNDSPETEFIIGGNFYFGHYYIENKLSFPSYIVDSENIFGNRSDFSYPNQFMQSNFTPNSQNKAYGKSPSAMAYMNITLKPKQTLQYVSVLGTVEHTKFLDPFLTQFSNPYFFDTQKHESNKIVSHLTQSIFTFSNFPIFDQYTAQTYIDNILRGGFPISLGQTKKIVSVFSRIHGDMEREYNNFILEPTFFSQGNGNYRDVNQNRRNDIYFNTDVKDRSIRYFFNLIQLDGYNPLRVLGIKFKLKNKTTFLKLFTSKQQKLISLFFNKKNFFSIGDFFNFLLSQNIPFLSRKEKILQILIDCSDSIDIAQHGEGYWTDHWHYNLDLIESYLNIYPEKLEELLFETKFTYFDTSYFVQPRSKKYILFNNTPTQLDSVLFIPEKEHSIAQRKEYPHLARLKNGLPLKTSLLSKLLIIIINKFASLDPEQLGVEMEANKPNWDDALNGLPGLFGSSLSETLELQRLIRFCLNVVKSFSDSKYEILIPNEAKKFMTGLYRIMNQQLSSFVFWDNSHILKEKYRESVFWGVEQLSPLSLKKIDSILTSFSNKLQTGIKKSRDKKTGLLHTYFYYDIKKYTILKKGKKILKNYRGHPYITILKFERKTLPPFLEGQVHALKILTPLEKKNLNTTVMKSSLYDKKLKMLKVNGPLKPLNYRLGRITSFPRGWLENESIWLHMEYKYLLELIKNNLANEFYKLSKTSLVPFMNPDIYGRSILENVSFIVSSAHPESNQHGRGFVARLSGATAEFLSMWVAITSGLKPFSIKDGSLILKFTPQIESSFFTHKKHTIPILHFNEPLPKHSFAYMFLGHTLVIYYNPKQKNTFGQNGVSVSSYKLYYKNGETVFIKTDYVPAPHSTNIRNGMVSKIECLLQ